MTFYREIKDKLPQKKKSLNTSEMKIILNWKLAAAAKEQQVSKTETEDLKIQPKQKSLQELDGVQN